MGINRSKRRVTPHSLIMREAAACGRTKQQPVWPADAVEEVATLRARIGELEQAVTKARDTFRHYGDLHAAKPDEVKAKRNYDLADEMQRALSSEREG